MRCIFCKANSDGSISVEHIIPESLGNTSHVLPLGMVCDTCNNYFSRKVEGPVLNSIYFRALRSEEFILSKQGRPAQLPALLAPGLNPLNLAFCPPDETNTLSIVLPNVKDWDLFAAHQKNNKKGTLIIPKCEDEPPPGIMDRFLAKVAVEALALRLNQKNIETMIDDEQLDLIRYFARYRKGPANWPYFQRIIYPRDKVHLTEDGLTSQVLHEFDFLFTEENELYFVLAIFGIEYTINMAGPELDGYYKWLKNNSDRSPLYPTEPAG